MKKTISAAERAARDRVHLSLARDEIQCSLPVVDTPVLVEELLEREVGSADQYLSQWSLPTIRWFC